MKTNDKKMEAAGIEKAAVALGSTTEPKTAPKSKRLARGETKRRRPSLRDRSNVAAEIIHAADVRAVRALRRRLWRELISETDEADDLLKRLITATHERENQIKGVR